MTDTVDLGATGLRVSRLCFGTGTNGWAGHSDQSALGVDGLARLLCFAHERGVTFWDTADQYGTHAHVAAALEQVGRHSVTVATKTTSRTGPEVEADVERFLRELRTDHIDVLLLHCLTEAAWPLRLQGAMEALTRARERGLVRAVGCSCHDFGALEASAASAWTEVNLVRMNYAGKSMCAGPERVGPVIARMAAAGKGAYGMKVVGGGGELTADPARAIRYTCGVDGVQAIVMGMVDEAQVIENTGLVADLEAVPA